MLALGASLFALAYVQPLVPLSSRSAVTRSSVTQMGGSGAPAGTSGKVRPSPPLVQLLVPGGCLVTLRLHSVPPVYRAVSQLRQRRRVHGQPEPKQGQPKPEPASCSRPCTHTQAFQHPRSGPTRASPPRVQKPPLKVLTRLESLGLLTSLSESGLLSGAESAGLFSKLEAAGAFSTAEKFLPLADKLNVFGVLESLLLVDSSALLLGAVALLVGEVGLITVVPDDNTALVALQAVTGVAAGAGAATLFGASALFGTLQSKN